MGLDSYLYVEVYLGYPNIDKEKLVRNVFPEFKDCKISYLKMEICYWRKNWTLHEWLVKECANGVDNCEEVDISKETATKLYTILNTILKEKYMQHKRPLAMKLLNAKSKDCDSWFFTQLIDTQKALKFYFDETQNHDFSMTYSASW